MHALKSPELPPPLPSSSCTQQSAEAAALDEPFLGPEEFSELEEASGIREQVAETQRPPFDMNEFARAADMRLRAYDAEMDSTPAVYARIVECGWRAMRVEAALRTGALAQFEAARILAEELVSIEESARKVGFEALASTTGALARAIEQLGEVPPET